MSNCCSNKPATTPTKKRPCPKCGQASYGVSTTTISHHLKQPWLWQDNSSNYYICESPACELVYFSQAGWISHETDVRTVVGVKHPADDESVLCYCFGIDHAQAASDPALKTYVIARTKSGACACETRNPSGRCCLKDFPANQPGYPSGQS